MLKLFKITGNSLFPLYKDGQRVLCLRTSRFYTLKKDDIVVFSKENYGLMMKQIKSIKDGQYFVQGTDPLSIDSRNFGTISFHDIQYKVLFRL